MCLYDLSLDSPYRMGKNDVTSLKRPSTSATSHHLRHLRNLTAGNGLHHLAHLIELFYEAIHLLYVSSTYQLSVTLTPEKPYLNSTSKYRRGSGS